MDVNLTIADPRVTELKTLLEQVLQNQTRLLAQGVTTMGKIEEQNALLDEINQYTNNLATQQEAEAAKLTELGADLDALIAQVSDATVTPRLQAVKDAIAAAAAAGTARAETLTNLAAKYDEPLPPPVEPPVEPMATRRR